MSSQPSSSVTPVTQNKPKATTNGRKWRVLVVVLVIISGLLTSAYAALSLYVATQLVYVAQKPLYSTPAAFGLNYQNVTFPSREDHIQLRGWLIPGGLPNGSLTVQRTIIFVHGTRTNRADEAAGLLKLSVAIARQGFAVLAFDMRGMGESPPAPLSLGYFEQRDVLGAADFLRSGPLPYPNLGRPRVIAGWGVSLGAVTLLLAAAKEPAIRALVSDSGYPDFASILEREVPKRGHLPPLFTPGALLAAQALYGINFYDVRHVDTVARIAPRPIFFIHGDKDSFNPSNNMFVLATAARSAPDAHVQTWLVPGADHAQSFNTAGQQYVTRVTDFYNLALGPDTGKVSGS